MKIKVDWSSELYSKRIRRMDPSFFLLHVLFAFKAEMGHNPRASARLILLSSLLISLFKGRGPQEAATAEGDNSDKVSCPNVQNTR